MTIDNYTEICIRSHVSRYQTSVYQEGVKKPQPEITYLLEWTNLPLCHRTYFCP